jgi:predicted dehydrogenase
MQPIGIGIIGTGFGLNVHLPALGEHPQAKAVALWHRDEHKAKTLAAKHDINLGTANLDQLLDLPELTAVAISTPPHLHYAQAKAAIIAGKHVFLEKPITLDLAQAIELYQLARSHGVVVATDFEFRFVPQWRYFHDLLSTAQINETIGGKRSIMINWLVQGRANPNRVWNWYSQKACGGGALGAIGSHSFDYVRWLFGDVTRLCGQLNTAITERPDADGVMQPVDVDDSCNILLQLADGTPCNIALSTVAYGGTGHWITVYGDQGTLILGSSHPSDYVHGFTVSFLKAGATEPEVLPIPAEYELPKTFTDGRIAPVSAVFGAWLTEINKVHHPEELEHNSPRAYMPSLKEGIYSQLLMDLTRESHDQRRWVDIPQLGTLAEGF